MFESLGIIALCAVIVVLGVLFLKGMAYLWRKNKAITGIGMTAVIGLAIYFLAFDSAEVDQKKLEAEQLSTILRLVGQDARYADKYYNQNLEIFNAIKMGKPLYQVHEEMEQPLSMLWANVSNMSNTQEEDLKKLTNPEIRKSVEEGMKLLINVYSTKYNFVRDTRNALTNFSEETLLGVTQKYDEPMDMIQVQAMQALAHFMDAKEKAGLPKELTEFQ